MSFIAKAATAIAALIVPVVAMANPVALTPADPQPSQGALKSGLAVTYAYPNDVKNISSARNAVTKWGEPGAPLAGLSYDDTEEGDLVLTATKAMKVAAEISGYIKFDVPGTYTLDFLNNDGLELSIGGQTVADYDGIHGCGYAGEIEVSVPQAGFYALEAIYFQRKGTACLMMEWGPDSDGLDYVPDSAFFYTP